jgi:hypothetical protein
MKNKIISATQYLSVFLIFIFLFIFPTILIPVSPSLLEKINPEEMKLFFPLLILLALYTASAYWLLIKNSNQKKMLLFIKLALANFLLYPLMGFIESFFWLDSLKVVGRDEIVSVFFRFLITFTLFSAYLSMISKKNTIADIKDERSINYKLISQKILLIAVIYIIIYNLFGYFVAWQFEATRIYYTGHSELKGFFTMLFQNFSDLKFVIVHFFRGILFGIAGYLFYTLLECSKSKKLLILALIFGGFGFQIILPNPVFPEMVRISHFVETTSSMMVFGLIVGFIFSNQEGKILTNK